MKALWACHCIERESQKAQTRKARGVLTKNSDRKAQELAQTVTTIALMLDGSILGGGVGDVLLYVAGIIIILDHVTALRRLRIAR